MKSHTEVVVDGVGQVVGVRHHDGQIIGIAFPSEGLVEICLRDSAGEENSVSLEGVEYFLVNNLREGNIVDRMYVWDLDAAPRFVIGPLLEALSANGLDALSQRLGGKIKVFRLESSFGAEVTALVRRICAQKCRSDQQGN